MLPRNIPAFGSIIQRLRSPRRLVGILACVDLSATPFYLGNSGYPEGSPFPWLVSDFGLVDAIECGITKVPRLPVSDDTKQKDDAGRPDPKYFRLWENIKKSCNTSEKVRNTPKTEAVYKYAQDALLTLASQWKVQFEKYQEDAAGKPFIPPVMIAVCDNTDVAQLIYEKIAGEREEEVPDPDNPKKTITVKRYGGGEVFPEQLANSEGVQRTIRIDTKLLAKLETEEGETKDDAALRMRELIDTVGKRGGLGEHVRCVVSVSMLTEGWDANNVTHILGIRAFGSQLLCEQVVGRGLRRMSYNPDPETGLLPAEYVDVYGIPFSLIPYKGKPKEKDPKPDPVYHAIYAMDERDDFEIRMPNVESYVYELREQGIKCEIDALEPLIVDQTPGEVWVRPPRGYQEDASPAEDTGDGVKHTREEYYKMVRPQQIVFRLAQMVLDDLMSGAQSENERALAELRLRARHQLFPELVTIVKKYIESKVTFREGLDPRELGLQIYARQVVERIRDNILPAASEKGKLIPILNRFRPYNSTADVNYQTTRPVVDLTKSHLNRAMIQSGAETGDYEVGAIEICEEMDCVECYTPNDRQVGLVVPYEYDGETKSYEPDFVIKLRGGVILMLEIKGEKGRLHDPNQVFAKNAAAKKWCAAVSNLGRFGHWEYEICDDLTKLRGMLLKHSDGGEGLPFEVVDAASATPWDACVPLSSLRMIGTKVDPQQLLAGGAWTTDLIRWDGQPKFEKGMFVAKVHGDAMEPMIPANSYCLFRPEVTGGKTGKVLFVKHTGLNDPHSGGNWTVRSVELVEKEEGGEEWTNDRVVLRPENAASPPFTLDLKSEDELQVFGEFVSVIAVKEHLSETDGTTCISP
jgi:type III restriction enzyme